MAKRQTAQKQPGFELDPALRKRITQAVALLAFLLGGYLLWQGSQGWLGMRGGEQALAARDRLAKELATELDAVQTRFAELARDPRALADAEAGELVDAARKLSLGWPEL